MAQSLNIKKGDMVYVLGGKDYRQRLTDASAEERARLTPQTTKAFVDRLPGRRGRVLRAMPKEGKVLVEGVNLVTKHARARGQTTRAAQMQTGRIQQPAALPVSRVMLVCPRCDRPTKVTRQHVAQKSIRVCRRCGEHVDEA